MKKYLDCAVDIGEQMLYYGAEVHRAEESVRRVCLALGASRADVFIITSSMMVTVHTDEGVFTQTRRITSSATDFERIHRLNELCRRICEHKIAPEEIPKALEDLTRCKKYPFWLECAAYSVITAAFTLFFGGSWREMLVAFVIGCVLRCCVFFAEKAIPNRIFSKFISQFCICNFS